jgi:hypothetical protein
VEATQITLVTGERCVVRGLLTDVEATVIAASRGSIMQLAWMTETASEESIGINPACIVSLRAHPATAN